MKAKTVFIDLTHKAWAHRKISLSGFCKEYAMAVFITLRAMGFANIENLSVRFKEASMRVPLSLC